MADDDRPIRPAGEAVMNMYAGLPPFVYEVSSAISGGNEHCCSATMFEECPLLRSQRFPPSKCQRFGRGTGRHPVTNTYIEDEDDEEDMSAQQVGDCNRVLWETVRSRVSCRARVQLQCPKTVIKKRNGQLKNAQQLLCERVVEFVSHSPKFCFLPCFVSHLSNLDQVACPFPFSRLMRSLISTMQNLERALLGLPPLGASDDEEDLPSDADEGINELNEAGVLERAAGRKLRYLPARDAKTAI
eukprot:3883331-Rhodomonas_salina.2